MKCFLFWLSQSLSKFLGAIAVVGVLASSSSALPVTETVRGKTGGSVDSKNCGFVGNKPSHTMTVAQRMDYMKMFVEAQGGQPTLLIVGPKRDDSFCVLGDASSGLNPEISGVWEPGNYQVYVGDREGGQHPFTLRILTEKN